MDRLSFELQCSGDLDLSSELKLRNKLFLEVTVPWAFCPWLLWSEWTEYYRF